MSPPSCQVELISISKDLIPNYEIQTILTEQISKAYPNYRKIYTDGSVQRERAGAGACTPSMNLNIYSPLPLGAFILSAELCAIRLALDALINYNMESENILCLFTLSLAIALLMTRIYIILEDSFLILRSKEMKFIFNMFLVIKALNIMKWLIL